MYTTFKAAENADIDSLPSLVPGVLPSCTIHTRKPEFAPLAAVSNQTDQCSPSAQL